MSGLDYVQTAASLAGVLVGGGIWFKLGVITGALKGLNAFTDELNSRIERLENHVFFGKE